MDDKKPYDIRIIFEKMELDLVASMKRAFYYHKREENKEGFEWEQWQLSKLRAIEQYRRENKKIVDSYAGPIQQAIDHELKGNFQKGKSRVSKLMNKIRNLLKINKNSKVQFPNDISQQTKIEGIRSTIAKAMGRPFTPPPDESFFGVNEKKLEALQQSIESDLKKAQQAVLRKMDDVYRQTIFKSHVYMQSGTKTLYQAIDMATKDFLNQGINCIEYKNGNRVNIASYAEMALRTASQRATFLGEGSKRDEYGIHLVIVSAHANTCEKCMPWQGKILIDDVFSHPSKEYIEEYSNKYKLLSEAIAAGLLHPNCRHTLTTYFEGITKIPTIPDGKEAVKTYEEEQKQRTLERQIRKWKRFREGFTDEDNKKYADLKVKEFEKQLINHLESNKQLRRNYEREKTDIRSINEINYKSDLREYENYREILKDRMSIEDFRNLKYNNTKEWNLVMDYAKSRSNGMISPLVSVEEYIKYKNLIEKELVGLTISNGIKITAQSKHFIERVFGTVEDPHTNRPRSGVQINDIKDAILMVVFVLEKVMKIA